MHKFSPNGNTPRTHWEKYEVDNPAVLEFVGDDALGIGSLRLTQDVLKDTPELLMKLHLE